MPLSLKTHHYSSKGRGVMTIDKITPYIRLCQGDGPPMFIQEGKVYCEGGSAVPENQLPKWFEEELAKADPKALKEVKFTGLVTKETKCGRPRKEEKVDGDD